MRDFNLTNATRDIEVEAFVASEVIFGMLDDDRFPRRRQFAPIYEVRRAAR